VCVIAAEKKVKKTAKKATNKAASTASTVPAAVAQKAEEADQSMPGGSSSDSKLSSSSSSPTTDSRATSPTPSDGESIVSASSSISDPGSLSETGEAASVEDDPQQAAFNPETGEINWDCPCLGGMAHGVCGEEFKAAFSCFVYSTEEPKGQDCIEKFRGMQECFRAHPDVYGEGEHGV
jgi:intermembrane space import and assembly protein 40